MNQSELAALAATGKLGAVHVGVHLTEFVSAYGDPVALGRVSKKRRWPHRFGYGDLEMVFCRCRTLTSFTIPTWRGELELPGLDHCASRVVDTRITESEAIAALRGAGCVWDVVEYETLRDQRTLQTTPLADVRVDFVFTGRVVGDSPPLDDWALNQVDIWSLSHKECPEPERTLPDDGFGA